MFVGFPLKFFKVLKFDYSLLKQLNVFLDNSLSSGRVIPYYRAFFKVEDEEGKSEIFSGLPHTKSGRPC